jgi:hypothetical protein
MQWQADIRILGVNCGTASTWIYFSNQYGIVGWREVWSTPEGTNRIVTAAVAAQHAGVKVRLWLDNPGRIWAIQTI